MKFNSTAIIGIIRDGKLAMAGDGQVTMKENMIVKQKAKKIRKIEKQNVLVGFAGAAADGITLFEKFEKKLEEFHGNIVRASVELAKEWRSDKVLRKLEAVMIVGNVEHLFLLSGNGDIIEPEENVIAIGSGGGYALAAARALLKHTSLSAEEIAKEALRIASSICVFTNQEITLEVI